MPNTPIGTFISVRPYCRYESMPSARYDAWFLMIHSSTITTENPIMIGSDSQT